MTAPTHALTLWPEWAWAIEALDKRVENRTWALPSRWLGQRVYLHAGAYLGWGVHRRRRMDVRGMARALRRSVSAVKTKLWIERGER